MTGHSGICKLCGKHAHLNIDEVCGECSFNYGDVSVLDTQTGKWKKKIHKLKVAELKT